MHTAAAAQASGAADPAPASAAGDLIQWVEGSGGSVSGVAVTRDGAGFGLQAAQGCIAGSTLIALPQRCHLTYDAATDPRLLALIEQVPAELWGAKLALQVRCVAGRPHSAACRQPLSASPLPILAGISSSAFQHYTSPHRAAALVICVAAPQVAAHRLQGEASPFAPYVRNLPMGVAGLPMFYSGEALGELQYPPVTEQVRGGQQGRWRG